MVLLSLSKFCRLHNKIMYETKSLLIYFACIIIIMDTYIIYMRLYYCIIIFLKVHNFHYNFVFCCGPRLEEKNLVAHGIKKVEQHCLRLSTRINFLLFYFLRYRGVEMRERESYGILACQIAICH